MSPSWDALPVEDVPAISLVDIRLVMESNLVNSFVQMSEGVHPLLADRADLLLQLYAQH